MRPRSAAGTLRTPMPVRGRTSTRQRRQAWSALATAFGKNAVALIPMAGLAAPRGDGLATIASLFGALFLLELAIFLAARAGQCRVTRARIGASVAALLGISITETLPAYASSMVALIVALEVAAVAGAPARLLLRSAALLLRIDLAVLLLSAPMPDLPLVLGGLAAFYWMLAGSTAAGTGRGSLVLVDACPALLIGGLWLTLVAQAAGSSAGSGIVGLAMLWAVVIAVIAIARARMSARSRGRLALADFSP